MDIGDVGYILIGFSWGLVIVEGIQVIAEGLTGVGEMVGMFSYPVSYNIYQSLYSQLPANVPQLQTAVNHSFQNYINYISQAQNYAAAVNTLVATLQIIAFIGAFIIILQILMRLLMPRTADAPAGY